MIEDINTPDSDKVFLIDKGFTLGTLGSLILTHIFPAMLEIVIGGVWISKKFDKTISLLLLTLMSVTMFWGVISSKSIVIYRDNLLKTRGAAWDKVISVISRYKVIYDFCKLNLATSDVNKSLDKLTNAEMMAQTLDLQAALAQQILVSICTILASLYIGLNIQSEKYSLQDFIFIVTYFMSLTNLIPQFGQAINQLFAAIPTLNLVFGKLKMPDGVVDLYYDKPFKLSSEIGPTIKFINVDFTFHSKEGTLEHILKNVSFTIPAGHKVALVSESGGGKTTIFNLLFGYYSPSSGRIEINGQDISKISLKSLQKNIGLFGQNPNLFQGSVRQNICYGAENPEDVTDEKILEIAEAVNLKEFLLGLPDKLNTDVGVAGKSLSGGEQQKIAILRGLFKRTFIQFFDEVTSSLDSHSATQVLQQIIYGRENTTSLIITHKLSEVEHADKIIVLDHGRIISQGKHHELLKKCELYQKLWRASIKKSTSKLMNTGLRSTGIFLTTDAAEEKNLSNNVNRL